MKHIPNRMPLPQQNMNQPGTGPQNVARFGAHEVLMTHEVLSNTINTINLFELYRPHTKDPQLQQILDNQLEFMTQSYNNLVDYLHHTGGAQGIPYRSPKRANVSYGLRNPQPNSPNANPDEMNDQDVAYGMLSATKASATANTVAALECADPTLRKMMSNCVQNSLNMAYEVFRYMNERGYYQVPTMQDNTTQTMINSYQPATTVNQMAF